MRIMRKGAAADHGVKYVTLVKGKASFDPSDGEFVIKFDDPAVDFSLTGSKHVYRTKFDLSEYLALTKRLAEAIKEVDDGEVLKTLQKSIPDFHRIATILATKG